VAREPTAFIARRGRHVRIVHDHGTRLTPHAKPVGSEEMGGPWHLVAPGKPMRDTGSARASARRCTSGSCPRRYSSALTTPATSSPPGWQTTTPLGPSRPSAARPRSLCRLLTATGNQLHETEAFRRSPIAPTAQAGNCQPPALASVRCVPGVRA
jgi:hypothetical protein